MTLQPGNVSTNKIKIPISSKYNPDDYTFKCAILGNPMNQSWTPIAANIVNVQNSGEHERDGVTFNIRCTSNITVNVIQACMFFEKKN